MEEILSNTLVPDNEVVKRATEQLKEEMKKETAIPQLCNIMTTSPRIEIRQSSALLLRSKLGKTSFWSTLPEETRAFIRQGCLQALMVEPEKTVGNAVARLVATLARNGDSTWTELFQYLSTAGVRQLFTISVIADVAVDLLLPHLQHFFPIFQAALTNGADVESAFYSVLAVKHLMTHLGSDEAKIVAPLIPLIIEVVKHLVANDQDKACQVFDIFEELFETEIPIVGPYIESIFELSLHISANDTVPESLRIMAISWLGRVSKVKRKVVANKRLLAPMVDMLFKLICEMPEEDEDEIFETNETGTPYAVASQTLDSVAIHLPPTKFMPIIMAHVQPALDSSDVDQLRGAFFCLGTIAEGCSEHIKRKHLVNFLKYIDLGIKHSSYPVRISALYALAQFSDVMQPDISNYAATILPVLLGNLDSELSQIAGKTENVESKLLERIFFALEIFCENLEAKLIPFLPDLMNRLLTIINGVFPLKAKVLSVSCIGSIANAVEDEIVPFFEVIMTPLKQFLVYDKNPDSFVIFNQTLDTLAYLARAAGPSGFAPTIADECCRLALELTEKYDDPDVRRCSYKLFAAVSTLVKEEMASVLPKVVSMLLVSATSQDGLIWDSDEDGDESGIVADALSDDADSFDGSNVKHKSITVENSYLEEKETAVVALREICHNVGRNFDVYLEKCTEEILPLVDFPDGDLSSSAVLALTEFALAFHKSENKEKFLQIINAILPKIGTMVVTEEVGSVVCSCLESVTLLLNGAKTDLTDIPGVTDTIVKCVTDVMKSNCACMDNDIESAEGEEAEQDEVIYEYAGDVIPSLGRAMLPSVFINYFVALAPMLLKKTSQNCTPSEKSFGCGAIAECIEFLSGYLDNNLVEPILKMFVSLAWDEDSDVRNNSVFGMGELALYGGKVVVPHFRQIMVTMSKLISKGEEEPRVRDQIVGCLSKLILADKSSVPLDEVLHVLFRFLPLEEDMSESKAACKAFQAIYQDRPDIIKANFSKIVQLIHKVTTAKKPDPEIVQINLDTLSTLVTLFGSDFQLVASQLSPDVQESLSKLMNRG